MRDLNFVEYRFILKLRRPGVSWIFPHGGIPLRGMGQARQRATLLGGAYLALKRSDNYPDIRGDALGLVLV